MLEPVSINIPKPFNTINIPKLYEPATVSAREPVFERTVTEVKNNAFDAFFESALKVVNETSQYSRVAEEAQIAFATGENDDMLSVILAQEKAYSTLNFTVQVTNKIIEAYREIMRIQM
jgi:flagellar hook-basal body complex protein FliE